MNSYKDLIIWQKGIDLVVLTYKLTDYFPKTEIYGLASQMRRAAVSVPSNISEGWSRKNTTEYINFLSITNGSLSELETQLVLSEKLSFGDRNSRNHCFDILSEIQKMVVASINTLRKSL